MSEFKGTKGKWLLNPLRNPIDPEYYCLYVKEGDHTTVQHIGTITSQYNDNKEEMIFNAKLISKAPEMLEMLKKLTSLLNDIDSTLFHHNHSVNGWHLNGDSEPIMNFVAEMDMECLSAAEQLIKEATE